MRSLVRVQSGALLEDLDENMISAIQGRILFLLKGFRREWMLRTFSTSDHRNLVAVNEFGFLRRLRQACNVRKSIVVNVVSPTGFPGDTAQVRQDSY